MMSMAAGFGWKIFPQVRTFLFPETKEVFYIGGADILPTPLNAREEAEAISGIGTERGEEVKKKLIATYASRCIENEILMYLRRNNKTRLEVSIDEPLNVDWDGNELLLSDILGTEEDTITRDLEHEAECRVLLKALGRLSRREQMIVRMRFGIGTGDGEEKTQKEVADILGISQSYISRLEKKIMQRLRREMVKYV